MSERDDLIAERNNAQRVATMYQRQIKALTVERDAAEERLRRVEALLKPYKCHQCQGTGQQHRGESGGLRSVDAPLPTETCHLCRGSGTVKPIGVTNHDLRAALAEREQEGA